jgi:hypothetical protein
MLSLLIPLLMAIAGVQSEDTPKNFDQRVQVRFILDTSVYTTFNWSDQTPYTGPEKHDALTASYPNAKDDVVGTLNLRYVNDNRFILWTPEKVEGRPSRLVSCPICPIYTADIAVRCLAHGRS